MTITEVQTTDYSQFRKPIQMVQRSTRLCNRQPSTVFTVATGQQSSEALSAFLIKLSAFGLPVFPSKINGFRLLAFGFQLASELCRPVARVEREAQRREVVNSRREEVAAGCRLVAGL
ncbi:hypothetical protein V9T40_014109 [Parthenolecanium corni]|uniref:Uncharacterized protein n=1 Tax=Parthenolecanium corni TaxID=536013 RepID=A0AAN9TDW9_9HEMI